MDVICMDYLFEFGFTKQRVGEVDRGFKREYLEDASAYGAKTVQFWKLQLQVGRISRAQIIAATKVCDLLKNLVPANKSTIKFYKKIYHFACEDTCTFNTFSLFRLIL